MASVYSNYHDLIDANSIKYGVPKVLITAVICKESSGLPNRTGGVGEKGLMQILPAALSDSNRYSGNKFTFDEMYDIAKNIEVGTAYLAWLASQFNGNFDLALRAYNAGIGNVKKNPNIDPAYLAQVKAFEELYSIT